MNKSTAGKTGVKAAALFVAAAVAAAAMPSSVSATSAETQKQLEEAQQQKEDTENALGENQQDINSLSGQKSGLEGKLSTLNTQLTEAGQNLTDIEARITDKNSEIEKTSSELDAATARADQQYADMKKRIQFMYEKGRGTYFLEMLLSSGSFTEFLNRQDYIQDLSQYDRRMLEEYKQTKQDISDRKAELEQERTDLEDLKSQAEAEQARVSSLVSQTSGSISATDSEIAGAQANADALQNQLETQNAQISALEAQLAEERRLEALSKASVWRNISQVTFADGDRELLAELIYSEAGNQPYEGQLAVGSVVINRVLSGAFPDTVVGVIYQANQFAPVADGHLALALAEKRATPSCYQAADAAMSGQTNVSDCIFFRTWIPEITPRYTIGAHIFY
ncbi:MAG: cell wall hydrolase [Lachnospiraceae bacterium]|nr:cell wall hydrolase [Lachnospiraceae bacterium]